MDDENVVYLTPKQVLSLVNGMNPNDCHVEVWIFTRNDKGEREGEVCKWYPHDDSVEVPMTMLSFLIKNSEPPF